MKLEKVDTSRLLADPNKRGFVTKLVKMSKVFDLNMKPLSDFKFLAYLVLVYDKNSYFRREIKNYMQRKYEAAVCAGFNVKVDGTFQREVENVIVGQNDKFNKAIVQYVSMQYDLDYAKLVIYEHNLYKKIQESFNKFDSKGDVKKLIDSLSQDIEKIEKKIFGGDEVMNVRRALYEGTAKSKLNVRIENITEEYAINQLRHLSPYGDYNLDYANVVNFVGDQMPKNGET